MKFILQNALSESLYFEDAILLESITNKNWDGFSSYERTLRRKLRKLSCYSNFNILIFNFPE